ncbi:MAG TPA: hypothetical protein VE990_13015 [Acidimicrobiales bacterium]|nr:hypothetical protein [Acidimicrobiales bacterium]
MRWSELTEQRPDLEAMARSMFYEHGLGLGFLATVRADGGPRVHPICPILAGNLYAFIVPGPKLGDLRRDPRYALHSETFPPPRHDDGAYLTGTVEELDDPSLRERLTAQILAERQLSQPWPGFDREPMLELHVDRLLITLTQARDGLPAGHTVWTPS